VPKVVYSITLERMIQIADEISKLFKWFGPIHHQAFTVSHGDIS